MNTISARCIYWTITDRRDAFMKVVVVRSPRLLAGVFRVMFRIKKEHISTD